MVTQEDEATIVVDVGSSSVKAGFSGEDTPRAVFPSVAEDMHLSAEDLSTYRARRPEVNHKKMRHAVVGWYTPTSEELPYKMHSSHLTRSVVSRSFSFGLGSRSH